MLRVALLAVSSVVAGCGGGSGTRSAGPTTTAFAAPDNTRLATLLPQLTDLPHGWTAELPDQSTAPTDPAALGLAVSDDPAVIADVAAHVESPDFYQGDEYIYATATSFKTNQTIATDLAAIHDPRFAAEFQRRDQAELVKDLDPGERLLSVNVSVDVDPLGVPPSVVAIIHETAKYAKARDRYSDITDTVVMRGRHVEVYLSFENTDTALPAAIRTDVVAKIDARVRQI